MLSSNSEIIKQVTSSWSIFIQLSSGYFVFGIATRKREENVSFPENCVIAHNSDAMVHEFVKVEQNKWPCITQD